MDGPSLCKSKHLNLTTRAPEQADEKRGFHHLCLLAGACMPGGDFIREGQGQLRLKSVVRGMMICLQWQEKVVVIQQQMGERAKG
jgi:hypothetical protein